MELSNKILENREEKIQFIKKYIDDFQVISLKTNIPGLNKNTKEANLLLNYFDNILLKKGIKKSFELNGEDGPMYVYLTSFDKDYKEEMIKIEETDVLGRFIDLDVFNKNYKSSNRSNLRKCYICDNSAFVCARNKTHTIQELNEYIVKAVNKKIYEIIYNLCNESILKELSLHPKFGLVTPYSNGSHKDLNYDIMILGKDAILDSFIEMFKVSFYSNNLEEIFVEIRNIGKEAEIKMFNKTNNVNTYKGLIFDLGLVVSAIGYQLGNNIKKSIFTIIQEMTNGISKELDNNIDSFGKYAYKKYNIGGARIEAEEGFPNVRNIIGKYNFEDDSHCFNALIELIYNTDDTNLLKRCGSLEKYHLVKDRFKDLKYEHNLIDEITKECIKENLTFGGSADLLIISIFIFKISQIFKIYL